MFMTENQYPYVEVVHNLWTMLKTHPVVTVLCLILMVGALLYGIRHLWKKDQQYIESLQEPKPVGGSLKKEENTNSQRVTLPKKNESAAAPVVPIRQSKPSSAESTGTVSSSTPELATQMLLMNQQVMDTPSSSGRSDHSSSSHHSHHSGGSWSSDHSSSSHSSSHSDHSSYSGSSGYSDSGSSGGSDSSGSSDSSSW